MARVEFNNDASSAIAVKGPHQLARHRLGKGEDPKIAIQLRVQILDALLIVRLHYVCPLRRILFYPSLRPNQAEYRTALSIFIWVLGRKPYSNISLNLNAGRNFAIKWRLKLVDIIENRYLTEPNPQIAQYL